MKRKYTNRIARAEARLQRACEASYWDPTGQDSENECQQAAADLISARDEALRAENPEAWAEARRDAWACGERDW